jgi:DNA repair protein RecO (recombination protein O)
MEIGRHTSQAVILKRTNYGEADVIVNFLTPESGKVSGMAKHGRKSMKRFGNVLTSFSLVELDFTVSRNRELVRLEKGTLLKPYERITLDAERTALAGSVLEIIDGLCAPLDPAPIIFRLLIWCLDRLDSGRQPEEAVFIFQIRMLSLTGFGPNISKCPVCGKSALDGQDIVLSPEQGGVACRACIPSGFPISLGTIKLMDLSLSLDLERIDRVRAASRVLDEAGPFLRAYITYTLGRELRSSRVIEQLRRRKQKVRG